jgi:LacI family transcriptional regulator
MDPDPELMLDCPSDVQAGQDAVRGLLERGVYFDAIFSSSDYAALGAQQLLKMVGRKVPEEVAIVGFGNAPFTSFLDPSITTVDQNGLQMGQCAARVFLEQINKGEDYIIRKHILQPQLIIRSSSP